MKVVTCYKVVRDEQDLQVAPDGTVSFEQTGLRVGDYDLNAIEAGVQLAAATAGTVIGLSVGGEELRDTKLRKAVLSRGLDEAVAVVDPALTVADAQATAEVLAVAVGTIDGCELVLCGEGSADRYSQQVGAQLAARLAVPYVNGVTRIDASDGSVLVTRVLEDELETLQVPLPAVLAVTSDANVPRIPSMKDILGAGRKPFGERSLADLGVAVPTPLVETSAEVAPEARARGSVVYQAAQADEFFSAVRKLLGKDAK
jgi:electron transfer flavoprotein beta subunit